MAADQRGLPRPVNNPFVTDASGGDGSDIGAFELQPASPTLSIVLGAYAFENMPSGVIPFTVDDADTPAVDLMVTATSSDTTVLPNSGIAMNGTGASRTIVMTPANGQTGMAVVTLKVSDGTNIGFGFIVLSVTNPPAITSDSKTVFTIGQQCPEIVLIGDDDTPIEVGTPCPFTVTSAGFPQSDAFTLIMPHDLRVSAHFIDNNWTDLNRTLGREFQRRARPATMR